MPMTSKQHSIRSDSEDAMSARPSPPKRRKVVHYVPQDNPKKFGSHLERRSPATDFRFRPSMGNSSLLARRARTNAPLLAGSPSGSLVPTNGNFVDLVTPEPPTPHDHIMDSGYVSTHSPYDTSASPIIYAKTGSPQSSPPNSRGGSAVATNPSNIPEYRARLEQSTENIFFQKYVSKNFTYDSRKAREQLKPVLRRALDRVEDRPLVDKHYLIINLKEGTVRGVHRLKHLRKKPGQRAFDYTQASWEGSDYMSGR